MNKALEPRIWEPGKFLSCELRTVHCLSPTPNFPARNALPSASSLVSTGFCVLRLLFSPASGPLLTGDHETRTIVWDGS